MPIKPIGTPGAVIPSSPSTPSARPAQATPTIERGWTPRVNARPQTGHAYGITLRPAPDDWRFTDAVREFQKPEHVPPRARNRFATASDAELKKGLSESWTQDVTVGGKSERMTVELTQKLIPVPYETFMKRLPAAEWGGPNLARYLGGEVQVVSRDAQGRPTRQLERMVLAQDDLSPLLGEHAQRLAGRFANDMTKAETITWGEDSSRVDWRVYGSNNGSTLADVGSVTFEKRGEGTLVTFHSAHKLGVPGTSQLGLPAIPLPAELVRKPLEQAFLAHANHYADVVR